MVKITIDDKEYDVPAGANLVDVAKQHGGIDIPVFCYHPKMDPVGMCRMCIVELGSIQRDRETGETLTDDKGNPQIRWFPTLQAACTQQVSDGMVVRTATKPVIEARENVVEFLLTSHPLDCPICDKGGECPLQNLTMDHGPGTSRMIFDDKQKLDKHVPLGDLIFLDQERCIQCARCVRFQDEVVGDDVLAFHERGRTLQIITNSDPGFDSYFSGNTTDICPVGALTTTDFRFGARPWELNEVPSICPHCPVGCNISASTRLDRDAGGRTIIKRVMPRQHEQVNEIWICDKGRFGHHFARSGDRLQEPMRIARKNLKAVSWDDALATASEALKSAGSNLAALAGSGMSNEDLWALRQLLAGLGSERLGAWPATHAGADLVAQVGVGAGTNLSDLGKGDAVLVIATDLEEEAPVWRLRLKQACERGAYVVVANARPTRMDDFANEVLRYDTGRAAAFMVDFKKNQKDAAKILADAENLVVVAGAEGLTLDGSRALMQAAANFLIDGKHVGRANNGLIGVFPGANAMGQYYLGYTPEATADIIANPPKVLIVAQADLAADDPAAIQLLEAAETVISFSLFEDDTAGYADVLLPVQSFAERDGSFVNGERRVQRFYTAQGPLGSALPAWQAFGRLGEALGQGRVKYSAAAVMREITQNVAAFEGAGFSELAKVEVQTPVVGDGDMYYGGTAYKNTGGLGVQIAAEADNGAKPKTVKVSPPKTEKAGKGKLLVVPATRLYNRQRTFRSSELVHPRVPDAYVEINEADARQLEIADGDMVQVALDGGVTVQARAHVDGGAPKGTLVLPRHLTTTTTSPTIGIGEVNKA